jgi:thiol:disulfide interchange protein
MKIQKSLFLLALVAFHLLGFGQQIEPVKWKFESGKTSGNEYELIFTATIDRPWHMYGMYIPSDGPIATTIHFEKETGYELVGKTTEVTKPVEKFDPNFKMNIALHSNKAIFRQIIKSASLPLIVKGTIEYQNCNDKECLLPVEKEFEIKVGAAGSESSLKSNISSPSSENKSIVSAAVPLNMLNDSSKTNGKARGIDSNKKETSTTIPVIKQGSLWRFFFLSFLGGLLGFLMPCVYPMIPMTVSFFMRGSENRGKGIMNGIIFGLSIILIYTLVGVIVALTSSGADIANVISTHWIPNLLFFLLFFIFAASFLGMFEIILPSSLTNKADQQVDKGGAFASFFMALTLALVSFSCTGPIVGAVLVEAANGQFLRPVIGMFGYSLAFALPFTFLAIFPSLIKSLPKSGGWLNSVKVVIGFILLAFGLKYLSNIDQAYHLNFLGRDIYLSIWIVLFFILGLYLLGKIRFANDSEITHIKVPRLLLAVASFSFVVYMIPGLFGAPLTGISSLIPPKTGKSFDLLKVLNGSNVVSESQANTASKLCDQPKYADILEMPYNLKGYFELEQGLACAKKLNKPVFLDLKGHTCTNCKAMEGEVWSDSEVLRRLRDDFVIIALYMDDKTDLPQNEWITSKLDGKVKKTLGKKNADYLMSKFGTNSIPLYVVLDTDGNPLIQPVGYSPDIKKFIDFLEKGKQEFSQLK